MNKSDVNAKSRNIVEPSFSSSQNSDEECYQPSCAQIQNRRKFVAEPTYLHSSSISHAPKQSILTLKQKIAQCMAIIHRKDQQILDVRQKLVKMEENVKFNENKNKELLLIIEEKNNCIISEKTAAEQMNRNYKIAEQKIQNQQFDKELLVRQVNYYQEQIEIANKNVAQHQLKIKQINQINQQQNLASREVRKQNKKFKEDIERLKKLLNETKKYQKIQSLIDNKHYVKNNSHLHSYDEKQNWVSANLIDKVEDFVKKNKGAKTRQVSDSLACFIERYTNSVVKMAQKKIKKTYSSKMKNAQRKHNFSLNLMQSHGQCLLKTSKPKSFKNDIHMKTFAQSSIQQRFEQSFPAAKKVKNNNSQLCIRILNELRKKLLKQNQSKQNSASTINILIDWAIQSLLSNYPTQKHYSSLNNSKTNQYVL